MDLVYQKQQLNQQQQQQQHQQPQQQRVPRELYRHSEAK